MPHLKEPMDVITDPKTETAVLHGSAQGGKTEIILNSCGFFIHLDSSAIHVYMPTVELSESFSKDRFMPMIRDTPELSDLFPPARSRDTENKILHKSFKGGRISFFGSNAPSGFRQRAARIIIFDDIDGFNPGGAGEEGDQIKLGIKRATTFLDRKIILSGTPTITDISRIDDAFFDSDQRHYNAPCHKCSTLQKLIWENVKWADGKPETAIYVCFKCGSGWNDSQRREMLGQGQWVSEAEFRGIPGFHFSDIINPFVRLGAMAKDFLDSKHKADHGNTPALQTWTNLSLGQSFAHTAHKIDADPLLTRRENYSVAALPAGVLYLTGSADIQGDRIEADIVGWRVEKRGDTPESWGIEHINLPGDPDEEPVWNDLEAVTLREYRTEDGRTLRIGAFCIDAGFKGDHVYRFCSTKVGRYIYAILGRGGPRPIWPIRGSKSKKHKMQFFVVGVDTAKFAVYSSLNVAQPGPGYSHFSTVFDKTYFDGLVCEKIGKRYVKGKEILYFFKRAGDRNEPLDLRAYNLAALNSRPVPWEMLARAAPDWPPPVLPEGSTPIALGEKPVVKMPTRIERRKIRFRFSR